MPAVGDGRLTDSAASTEPLLELRRFTGPLDLLLTLVEQRRLPITEISLAEVAEQYLGYLNRLDEPDRDLLARFVSIGGRLLLLKSRTLLPRETAFLDDQAGDADDLVRALEEFRVIRRALEWLEGRLAQPAYPRGLRDEPSEALAPLAPPSPDDLERALRRLLERGSLATVQGPDTFARVRVTVAARLGDLRAILARREVIDWPEVAGDTLDTVVATFLAVLELIRRGEIAVTQEETFGPIRLLALREGGPIPSHEGGVSPDAEYT